MHPGSYTDSSEEAGLNRIVEALNQVNKKTKGFVTEIWLETTAGQGTNLGHRFEHLGFIIEHVSDAERLGVCVDTCHIFAAGYAIQTAEEYEITMEEFDRTIGIERIRAFHLNDSKREQGSRVDRHEHIGKGHLGLDPFRHVLQDPRFKDHPIYLETSKGSENGKEWDAVNMGVLRRLSKRAATRRKSRKSK